MTEADLIEAINATLDIHLSTLLAYLSIVSAYLIAAFIAGDKLTSLQSVIVSTLFIFASTMCALALWGSGSRISYMVDALLLADPSHPIIYSNNFRNGMTLLCLLGIAASLKFMWDIRHPKTV
ncbi:hypothetical protein N9241_00330 [bacterium]|nr:hypothetical protein [bacterium]